MGEVIESPCPDCRGDGRRTEDRTITVEVPAGVDDGTTLRITGSGAAAVRGGITGDLYVHLRVAPSAQFERSGADLVATYHLAMTQAALGADVEVTTLDGPEMMNVPAGTESGKVVRVKGKGVPHLRARGRGDLHVRFVVDTPTDLDKEQERLLRELAIIRGEEVASAENGLLSRIRSNFG